MKKLLTILTLCSIGVFFNACYKDIGNYDYKEVNSISLDLDVAGPITVVQFDILKLKAIVTETMNAPDGYEYKWVLFPGNATPLTRRTLGTGSSLEERISEVPGSYLLQVFVTDKATGIEKMLQRSVTVAGKYSEGWIVLHETAAQNKELAMINILGTVYQDVYGQANDGKKLIAGASNVDVVRDRLGTLKVYVMGQGGMHQLNQADFFEVATLNNMFWAAPEDRNPKRYFIKGSDELMINNGLPFGLSTMVPAPYAFGAAGGTHRVSPFEIYYVTTGFVLYDEEDQKFVRLSIPSTIIPISQSLPESAAFDLNNIGKKLIYAEESGNIIFNMLFKDNDSDQLYCYIMNLSKADQAISKTEIIAGDAPHAHEASCYSMAKLNPHLYYAYDNVLYLLDFPASKARAIYTFPAGTKITASELYNNTKVSTDPDNNRLLVLGVYENGAGKVYTLPISPTGDIENNTYRNVYSGFGKILDVSFKRIP